MALTLPGRLVLDAPVPLAGAGAAHGQGAQEVVAEPAAGAFGRHGHQHLRGGAAAGGHDQDRAVARGLAVVTGAGQPLLVDDRDLVPGAHGAHRVETRVFEQLTVGDVAALASVVAQQGTGPAELPPLRLRGGLPGYLAQLAPDAGPRITRRPGIIPGPLRHDHESSITGWLLSRRANRNIMAVAA